MTTVRLFDRRCHVGIGRMSLQFFGVLTILLHFVFVLWRSFNSLPLCPGVVFVTVKKCCWCPKDELVQIGDPINGNRDFVLVSYYIHGSCV
ncbi:hypothetical protein TorRG33x02_242490, partial [Trema orientale]